MAPSSTPTCAACQALAMDSSPIYASGKREKQMCKVSLTIWLNSLAGGITGSSTNWSTVGKLILQGLEKAISKEAPLALVLAVSITVGPEMLAALAVFETTASIGIAGLAVLEVLIADTMPSVQAVPSRTFA
jgi:hypothetical protein